MTIKIKKDIYDTLIDHAKQELPIESCGYLAGTDQLITTFYPMTNIDKSHEHFTFDPKEQFQVVKKARNDKLSILSVYHSHPSSPARLSKEDIRLFNAPNMIYIIVSLKEETPDIKAYTLKKEGPDNITINAVPIEKV